ncbi:hypothetical protein ACCD06_27870 [Azospirillum sp. CT11-132]|uniref:hypothetical protein n=1 Tax=Azospirillum sp. CT11-132 TaxID=3396317 RepID=UPI0039A6F123
MTREASAFHFSVEPANARLRRLPYPYQGALSVATDAEGFSPSFFHALMAWLNGRSRTPFGTGLGLEITGSLFFYDRTGASMAYFDSATPGGRPGPQAALLEDYLRTGWIDTNHAFGDFQGGGFGRAHALEAYGALARMGVSLPVFTNHGNADNWQNVGIDADYHAGDRAGHPAYHSDLFPSAGTRFVWTDSLYLESASPVPLPLFVPSPLQDTLGNEASILGFRRLRGTGRNAPNLSSLLAQLRLLPWNRLYKEQGTAILYQHLGVLHKAQGILTPASIEAALARPDLLLAPFRFLARERDEGRLWVVGLARLLRYACALSSVRLSGGQGVGVIELHDPPGNALSPEGLTLYIDPALPIRVIHRGKPLEFWHNGPDETGRYSITMASTSLPDIWS